MGACRKTAVKVTVLSRKTNKETTDVGGDKDPAGSLDSHYGLAFGKMEKAQEFVFSLAREHRK